MPEKSPGGPEQPQTPEIQNVPERLGSLGDAFEKIRVVESKPNKQQDQIKEPIIPIPSETPKKPEILPEVPVVKEKITPRAVKTVVKKEIKPNVPTEREKLFSSVRASDAFLPEDQSRINKMHDPELKKFHTEVGHIEDLSDEVVRLSHVPAGQEAQPRLIKKDLGKDAAAPVETESKKEAETKTEIPDTGILKELEKKAEPKVAFPNPHSETLKAEMRKVSAEEPKQWSHVIKGEIALAQKYNITVAPGLDGAEVNLATQGKVAELLSLLPKDSYQGKRFRLGMSRGHADPIFVRPDGTIEINPKSSVQELHDFYSSEVMGIPHESLEAKHAREVKGLLDRLDNEGPPPYITTDMIRILMQHGIPLHEISSENKTPAQTLEMLRDGKAPEKVVEEPKTKTDSVEVTANNEPVVDTAPTIKIPTPKPTASPDVTINTKSPDTNNIKPDVKPGTPAVSTPELEAKMQSVREKYVEKQRDLDKFHSLGAIRKKIKGKEAKERIEIAFGVAKQEYEQARAEYIGANVDRYLSEQSLINANRLREYGRGRESTIWQKLQKGYERTGEITLYNYYKRHNPDLKINKVEEFLLKKLNARVAINAGLIGAGLSGGMYVGGAALVTRRLMSGISAGLGFRGMAEMARKWKNRDELTEHDAGNLKDITAVMKHMRRLESTAFFDGNNAKDVDAMPVYRKLVERQTEFLREIEKNPEAQENLQKQFTLAEEDFSEALVKEKKGRNRTAAFGGVAGALVGGGVTGKILGKTAEYFVGKAPLVETPVEVVSVLKIGGNGIEGSLLETKTSNPELYGKIMARLHEQYPDSKAKDSTLIHRMVKKLATENGFTIDGGGKDLSKIVSGGIEINSDGSFSLNGSKINFAPDASQPLEAFDTPPQPVEKSDANVVISETEPKSQVNSIEANQTVPGSDWINQIPNERLDLTKLSETESISPEKLDYTKTSLLLEQDAGVAKIEKTTDALRHILKDKYSNFLNNQVMMDSRELNTIQNSTVNEVIKEYNLSGFPPAKAKRYAGLIELMKSNIQAHPDLINEIKGESVRRFLIRVAIERNSK